MSNDVYEVIVNKWRDCKGSAAYNCIYPVNPYDLAIYTINKMRVSHPNTKALVLCSSYIAFTEANKAFGETNTEATILSFNFIKPNYSYKYDVCIAIGFNSVLETLLNIFVQSKFKFMLLTKTNIDAYALSTIQKYFKIIEPVTNVQTSIESRNMSPVEEYRVSITLSDKDKITYDKYTEYITQSVNIFGNFDNINKARLGDKNLNLSATDFCYKLAIANGWNENMNTTEEFNRAVDSCYNPISIKERAGVVYNIMRERALLLTDNKDKLQSILDIIKDNPGKKIIIVSKRGEYARLITKYLLSNSIAVGDYHDCIEPMLAMDNSGRPILVKSGINKGKPRIIKSKAISTNNLNKFNSCDNYNASDRQNWFLSDYQLAGCINVLSIKNSSSDELKGVSDIVIFTSSLCDTWDKFIYRFNGIDIRNNIRIYKIFFADTIEETSVKKVVGNDNYIIHEEEKKLNYDENSGNIVL